MKVTVETSPAEKSILTDCSISAARSAARELWPNMNPSVRNAIVAIIRGQTDKDDPCPTK